MYPSRLAVRGGNATVHPPRVCTRCTCHALAVYATDVAHAVAGVLADWIWWADQCSNLGEAWLRLNFTVPWSGTAPCR